MPTESETLSVLKALVAYVDNRLPSYTCTPHGPGHKTEWIDRADRLIENGRLREIEGRHEWGAVGRRKQFIYRGITVTPRPEMFWAVGSLLGSGWMWVKTKAKAKRVIDALID